MGLMNRAFRNVWRKKTVTMLVVLALGFSIAAIISVNTGIEASNENTQVMINEEIARTEDMIDDYEQHLYDMENITDTQMKQILVMSDRKSGSDELITKSDMNQIESMNSVEVVLPSVETFYGGERRNPDFIVYGVVLDPELNEKYQILPSSIEEGRVPNEDSNNEVLIREDLKDYFNVEVGGWITIDGKNFKVVGTYLSSNDMGAGVYMDIAAAQSLMDLGSNTYHRLSVYANDVSDVEGLVVDLDDQFPSYRVTSYEDFGAMSVDRMKAAQEDQIEEMEEDMNLQVVMLESDMTEIESTGSQLMLVSMITAGMIVLFMMQYSVKERVKEIGVLKAIGFSKDSIMSQFIIEGTAIGFMGGVVGITVGWVATPVISGILLPSSDAYAVTNPSIQFIGIALVLAAFLGAFGSIYPAWCASRMSPAEAIRNV